MKRARIQNIISLVINFLIIGAAVAGVLLYKDTFSIDELKHFAVLTALVTVLSSVLMIIPNIINIKHDEIRTPKLFFSIRYLSATMSLITLVAVLCFICPSYADGFKDLFNIKDGYFFFQFLIPVLSLIMFLLFETGKKERFGATFVPLVCVTLYAAGIIIAAAVVYKQNGAKAAAEFVPNFFFILKQDVLDEFKQLPGMEVYANLTLRRCIIFATTTYLLAYVNALIVFSINRLTYALGVGQEYKDEATIAKEEKAKEEEKQAKANMTIGEKISHFVKEEVALKPEIQYNQLDHIYHVSYHDRKLKTWKVKSENAGRALKVFKNQKEAVEYAKKQVKLHGGSIRVHSIKGAIRKKGNWDTFDK